MVISSKSSSVAGIALDILLKLVAPEFCHKPWNYHKELCLYFKVQNTEPVKFAHRDQRFGCLNRAATVILLAGHLHIV